MPVCVISVQGKGGTSLCDLAILYEIIMLKPLTIEPRTGKMYPLKPIT